MVAAIALAASVFPASALGRGPASKATNASAKTEKSAPAGQVIEWVVDDLETGTSRTEWVMLGEDGTETELDASHPAVARKREADRAAPTTATAGEHDLAIFLIDMTASGVTPFDASEIADMIYPSDSVVNTVLGESSYGEAIFTGSEADVFGWFRPAGLPADTACRGGLSTSWLIDIFIAEEIQFDGYDHALMYFNCDEVEGGGASTLGQYNYAIGDETCACSSAWVARLWDRWTGLDSGADGDVTGQPGALWPSSVQGVTTHELGHSLGVGHDGALDCGNASWGTPENCSNYQYGNMFSIMGMRRGLGYGMSAASRYRGGWIQTDLQAITTSGTYTIGSLSTATPTGPRAASVVGSSGDIEYFIELRTADGVDSNLAFGPAGNEAQIHTANYEVIDAVPYQPGAGLFDDFSLVGFAEGQVFDDGLGVEITIDEIDRISKTLTFTVDYAFDPAPTSTPTQTPTQTSAPTPSATVTPAQTAAPTPTSTSTPPSPVTPLPTVTPFSTVTPPTIPTLVAPTRTVISFPTVIVGIPTRTVISAPTFVVPTSTVISQPTLVAATQTPVAYPTRVSPDSISSVSSVSSS